MTQLDPAPHTAISCAYLGLLDSLDGSLDTFTLPLPPLHRTRLPPTPLPHHTYTTAATTCHTVCIRIPFCRLLITHTHGYSSAPVTVLPFRYAWLIHCRITFLPHIPGSFTTVVPHYATLPTAYRLPVTTYGYNTLRLVAPHVHIPLPPCRTAAALLLPSTAARSLPHRGFRCAARLFCHRCLVPYAPCPVYTHARLRIPRLAVCRTVPCLVWLSRTAAAAAPRFIPTVHYTYRWFTHLLPLHTRLYLGF